MFFDINAWEAMIIIVLAVVLIGPDRLPEYAGKLARAVRQLKQLAEGAKGQLREQMGPEFDDIDWAAYDPRQYDPRRIVREALASDPSEGSGAATAGSMAGSVAGSAAGSMMGHREHEATGYPAPVTFDPGLPTPYDPDAT